MQVGARREAYITLRTRVLLAFQVNRVYMLANVRSSKTCVVAVPAAELLLVRRVLGLVVVRQVGSIRKTRRALRALVGFQLSVASRVVIAESVTGSEPLWALGASVRARVSLNMPGKLVLGIERFAADRTGEGRVDLLIVGK